MVKKTKFYYDSENDIAWIVLKSGYEAFYEEYFPGVNIEFNDKLEPIGIEFMDFSRLINLTSESKKTTSNFHKSYYITGSCPESISYKVFSEKNQIISNF